MNLAFLREQLMSVCHRFDLVKDAITPDKELPDYKIDKRLGIDFFINAGISFLETRVRTQGEADSIVKLPAEDGTIIVKNLRTLSAIYFNTSGTSWRRLHNSEFEEVSLRHAPDVIDVDLKKVTAQLFEQLPFNTMANKRAFRVFNHVPGNYLVRGLYNLPPLVHPEDTNYWVFSKTHLAQWAAMYMIEVSYRNTEGSKTWLMSLETELEMLHWEFASDIYNRVMYGTGIRTSD